MGTLSIRETFKGLIPSLVLFYGMVAVCIIGATIASGYTHSLDRGTASLAETFHFMLTALAWILGLSALVLFMHKGQEYEIEKVGKYWGRITTTGFAILGGEETTLVFDRIVKIKLRDSIIDRYLGTGTLVVTVITYSNTGPVKSKFSLEHIENVRRVKELLMLHTPATSEEARAAQTAPQPA